MCIATIVWGISLRAYAPELFTGNEGILATNTALSWLAIVVVMAASTFVAGVSVIREFSARAADGTSR